MRGMTTEKYTFGQIAKLRALHELGCEIKPDWNEMLEQVASDMGEFPLTDEGINTALDRYVQEKAQKSS